MIRIDHSTHGHPLTKAARGACRKALDTEATRMGTVRALVKAPERTSARSAAQAQRLSVRDAQRPAVTAKRPAKAPVKA